MFIYNIKNTTATFSHNTIYNIILILIPLIYHLKKKSIKEKICFRYHGVFILYNS